METLPRIARPFHQGGEGKRVDGAFRDGQTGTVRIGGGEGKTVALIASRDFQTEFVPCSPQRSGLCAALRVLADKHAIMMQNPLNPLITRDLAGFLLLPSACFLLIFPLQIHNVLDKAFHSGCAVLHHALSDMAVNVQSKSGGGVT